MMLDDALFAASRCNGLRGGDGITDGTPRHPVVSVERNDLRFALCLCLRLGYAAGDGGAKR